MKIAFNPSTVAVLTTPPNNKDITFDLRGRNIFARGVKFYGTDTNTWRDIKINNVSIGSHTLDLQNGSNTTLTNTNGVVTINSTWRPVVDNLTSDSTTSSLSAKQGKVLKALIDGKSNSDHNHDGRYLKLTGGTMASNALITFADSGSWDTSKKPQGARGGLYWTGQSDYAKLYAEETAGNNLDLVIQFGDDNSNGLSIRNKDNTQTSYISSSGVITTGTFRGNLDWSYITNKPDTVTRWPSWDEVTEKPSYFTPYTHSHGLSNSVFFLNMPSIDGNAKWEEVFGYPVNYDLLFSVRINDPAPEWCVGNFGSGILYGGSDTKGFMSSAYNEPFIMWAGGDGNSDDSVPKWYIGIKGTHKSIYNLATIASEANAAYNLRHSHANKSVLDGITSALVNSWNTAYNFVSNITGTDTDKVINKWEEIVNFLAGITEDNKLNTLLNSKLSIQQLSAKDILTTKTNNALFWVDTKDNASTITTGPFTDHPYALLSVTNYNQNAGNYKFFYRSRLAFSSAGDIKVASCHHEYEYQQDETWYNVLTSKNSGISGSTIKLNGTSITVYSSGTADGRYLKLTGGTMASNALITFADSGSWDTSKKPQGARGGLYWTGQSDYAKLYAEETAGNNLDLVIQFGDDNSNGLSIRNKDNTQTSYISSSGVITTGTFRGNLDWSYITNKPDTVTRWPSWDEVTEKPSYFTPYTHSHGLSNSVFFLNMPSIDGNAKWEEVFGYPVNYDLLFSVRINDPAPEWCVGNFGSGILYGGSDTKGFMSSAYNEPFIMWAGGDGNSDDSVPKWYIGIKGTHKSIYNLATIASEANAAYNFVSNGTADGRYVKKSGDTMQGVLTIDTTNFGALTIKRNDDANGASIQFRGESRVYGYIGLDNSTKDKQFLRWNSDISRAYTILDTSSTYISNGKGVINGTTITQVDNADTVDGYHENSFLRYRGVTYTDQEATLWSQIGIKQYDNALPDNLTGVYNYGSVISLPGSRSRFEIYASHQSSYGNGLYYRSGWIDDKKAWLKFIDSSNIGSQSVNYANSAGHANSAGNADTLGGIPRNYGQAPFGTIPSIGNDGIMEIGKCIDFHYDNSGSYDYSTRLQVLSDYKNTVSLPSKSGTLALTTYGGEVTNPIFLGYLDLYGGSDGTVSSYFYCLGQTVPFTYTRGGNYCKINIPDTTSLTFYIRAAIASVHYSGRGMDTWTGYHRGAGAWWLHCYALIFNEVRVKGFCQADKSKDSWWGGNPLLDNEYGANEITVCLFGYVRYK